MKASSPSYRNFSNVDRVPRPSVQLVDIVSAGGTGGENLSLGSEVAPLAPVSSGGIPLRLPLDGLVGRLARPEEKLVHLTGPAGLGLTVRYEGVLVAGRRNVWVDVLVPGLLLARQDGAQLDVDNVPVMTRDRDENGLTDRWSQQGGGGRGAGHLAAGAGVVVLLPSPSLPFPGVGGAGPARPTEGVVAEPLAVAGGGAREVVDLVRPGPPVLVMIHQLPQLLVPGLHSTRLEVFPEEAGRPEYAGVEPVQFPAGTAGKKSAEIFRLRSVVVRGILLDVTELKQLDVLLD